MAQRRSNRCLTAAPAHLHNVLPAAREASAEQFKDTANAFFKRGDYAEAVKGYSRAIQACPKNPMYYNNRAAARLKVRVCVGIQFVDMLAWPDCCFAHCQHCAVTSYQGSPRMHLPDPRVGKRSPAEL